MRCQLYVFDNQQVAVEGITSYLSKKTGFKIAGQATNLKDSLAIISRTRSSEEPIIAITELSFKKSGGGDNIEGTSVIYNKQ